MPPDTDVRPSAHAHHPPPPADAPHGPPREGPPADGPPAPEPSLLDAIDLPLLTDLEVVGWVQEAVRDAVRHRQGVIVHGAKGSGRSEALELVAARFRAMEADRVRSRPGYRARHLRVFPAMGPRTRNDLIRTLYVEEMGAIPWRVGRGGDDVMLHTLVAAWREDHVAAVCFTEVDAFGAGALEGCRDIMAFSEGPAGRAGAVGAAGPTPSARGRRAAGVGIVLVGVTAVYDRLRGTPEWGHRWRKAFPIEGLAPGVLPDVYRRLLPACARYAAAVGEAAWVALITREVAPSVGPALRRVQMHLEDYVGACVDECDPPPAALADVPFDRERFVDTARSLAGADLLRDGEDV
jgi:hypothetical protein